MKKMVAIAMAGAFILSSLSGCITENTMKISPVKAAHISNPKAAFASYYSHEGLSVNLNAGGYTLPLNPDKVENFQEMAALFNLTGEQKSLLAKNGFVVIDYGKVNDVVEAYKNLKGENVPIFITSDSLLHLYHIQFNELLKSIEERELFDSILNISVSMAEKAESDYESFDNALLKEAARRNVAFFMVGLELLQTPSEGYNGSENIREVGVNVPDYAEDDVNAELNAIENHKGFEKSAIFGYDEDYSQYVPRGHYTRSEKLERYFKAMMWYGRMAFLLKGGEGALISEEDAKIATVQASLISIELNETDAGGGTSMDKWERIYAITSFFVGLADDLTPVEYSDSIKKVFGSAFNFTALASDDGLLSLEAELAQLRSPQIYGGSGACEIAPPFTKEKLDECLDKTKGMRFMGQRFVPDSYMFQQLVSPAVGMYAGNKFGDDRPFTMEITDGGPARCFPRGLDVMAVMGSERAKDILVYEGDTAYEDKNSNTSYDKQLAMLREEFDGFNVTEWNRNLYWGWLYTLKALLKDFGDGYPAFMRTNAWLDKELQTALSSWTELRHDTILYAKQSYTPKLTSMPPSPVSGYAEPVPEFYLRLKALTNMTFEGLDHMNVLNETEKNRLGVLENALQRLVNISVKELEGSGLDDSDLLFIENFGDSMERAVEGTGKGKELTMVADVHTDMNTGNCLEEGVGYADLMLVAYEDHGKIVVGAGPVFSYYEFKQPIGDRLTDGEWKDMLEVRANEPARPEWVNSFMAT